MTKELIITFGIVILFFILFFWYLFYAINYNCDLTEEKGERIGVINAFAAVHGWGIAFLCSLNIISSVICSIACITMLVLSILSKNSIVKLKICNVLTWTICLVTSCSRLF